MLCNASMLKNHSEYESRFEHYNVTGDLDTEPRHPSTICANVRLATSCLGAWPTPWKAWICCLSPIQPDLPAKPGSKHLRFIPSGLDPIAVCWWSSLAGRGCPQNWKISFTSLEVCPTVHIAQMQGTKSTPQSASFTRLKHNSKQFTCRKLQISELHFIPS